MLRARRGFGLAILSTLLISIQPARSADFSLNITSLDSQRRPTLSMSGLTTGRYALDASTNLTQWFRLTSASASAGPLVYLHQEAAQLGTVFYRGQQLPDAVAIVPQVDSNYVAVGMVTFAEGGSLALTNESGVRYTFTVAPSNVIEAVAIRMQLVTNFASFPYANESRTAVLFEPSGFEFHGSGLLEIQYPTNIPIAKVSSFAFNSKGAGFFLTPDVVTSNRIRIPVTHFSGVGSGLWAPSERTAATMANVENARDRSAHEIASVLGEERNRIDRGEPPATTSELAELVLQREQNHYDNVLKPLFPQAATDCALAQSLIPELLGMDRSDQLLGITNGPASAFLGSPEYKSWMCNCAQEALNACTNGVISDQTLVEKLIAIERNFALLGIGSAFEECGLGSYDALIEQAVNKKLPCVPDWFGSVSYSDGGSRTADCSGGTPGKTCSTTFSASLNFEAHVDRVELLDESFPPFFYRQTWTLKLFPEANATYGRNSRSSETIPCGATSTTTRNLSGAGSGPLDLEVVFVFEDNELVDFTIDTAEFGGVRINWSEVASTVTGPCPGGGSGSSSSHNFAGNVSLTPQPAIIDRITFTKRTTTALEGSLRGTRVGIEGIQMPFSWTFSLHRNAR
jgi:hypothetical protein